MLRVAIDHRTTAGGVGRYGRDLVAGLAALDEAPEIDLHDRSVGGRAFTPWGRRSLARFADQHRSDMVHGAHLETPRTSLPVVVTIPDLIPLEFSAAMPNPVRRSLYRRIVASSVRRAVRVITHSRLAADALESFGAEPDRITVIPHGVGPLFRPSSDKQPARDRYALGRPYVAAVAGSKPHKNLDGLAAAARLMAADSDIDFVVRSGTAPPPGLRGVSRLSESDLASFYAGAEALVVPSLIEGFGLPALEAAACGVPVVLGPRCGVAELLEGAALVVDTSSPRVIADSIRRLLDDADLARALGERGISVAATCTLTRSATLHLRVYEEAIAAA